MIPNQISLCEGCTDIIIRVKMKSDTTLKFTIIEESFKHNCDACGLYAILYTVKVVTKNAVEQRTGLKWCALVLNKELGYTECDECVHHPKHVGLWALYYHNCAVKGEIRFNKFFWEYKNKSIIGDCSSFFRRGSVCGYCKTLYLGGDTAIDENGNSLCYCTHHVENQPNYIPKEWKIKLDNGLSIIL